MTVKRNDEVIQRFWRKAHKIEDGCWIWIGALSDTGYGTFNVNPQVVLAHRLAYQLIKGDIPPKYQLDHLCRNRSCVNPAHLEAVTSAVNNYRSNNDRFIPMKTGCCLRGHPITPDNVYFRKDRPGRWNCQVCERLRRSLRNRSSLTR